MNANQHQLIVTLVSTTRTAALGTLRDGWPFASFVAFAPEADFAGFLLHLSTLSPHTQHLAADPRASLLIAERDDERDDPQTIARLTILGTVVPIRDSLEYTRAKATYLTRLPASAMLFDFADFALYRFIPTEARYIGGFALAFALSAEQLQAAWK